MFIPQGAFELIVKKQIELLKEPSLQCADMVLSELQRIAIRLENTVRLLRRISFNTTLKYYVGAKPI